ncbi:MAG: YIP1 family protein [Terracidiphilus sp.]|jgi:hypothetical protein
MSDLEVQSVAAPVPAAPGLSQWQRVSNVFSAPSKTFEDIKRGNKSWWLPLIIMFLSYSVVYGVVSTHITWAQVYENQQRNLPEFARNMMDRMTPEQKAAQAQQGPKSTAITQAFAPFGILILDLIGAGILLATINFGFGGKATYSSLLAVELYAGMAIWPIRWLLAAVATLFTDPESFNVQNPAPSNVAAFMSFQETPKALYYFLMSLDALNIWGMVLTAIGVAVVAKVSRTSGYIAVFGWWVVGLGLGVAMGAMFS